MLATLRVDPSESGTVHALGQLVTLIEGRREGPARPEEKEALCVVIASMSTHVTSEEVYMWSCRAVVNICRDRSAHFDLEGSVQVGTAGESSVGIREVLHAVHFLSEFGGDNGGARCWLGSGTTTPLPML